MVEFLFGFSVFFIFFAYLGYPLSLQLIAAVRQLSVRKKRNFPCVTFIVTVHNEEKRIGNKLRETLALDYPRDKFQVIVASDGSSDGTHDIVSRFEADGVALVATERRGGKEQAQKEAITHARGEILVFSDVATQLDRNAVTEIVSNFADPSVGCVSSEDRLISKDGTLRGEGAYVRYEMWLRRLESAVNSIVGLSGSFFAARKEVCHDFSENRQSDFRLLLYSMHLGYRGVSDPNALGYYRDISDGTKEFDRKVRTIVRGLTVFFENAGCLNPFKFGFFSYQLLCHKLFRWLVPYFLMIALVTNVLLALSSLSFTVLLVCQSVFYGVALVEKMRSRPFERSLLTLPGYFVRVNVAIVLAWVRYIGGHRIVVWNPSER